MGLMGPMIDRQYRTQVAYKVTLVIRRTAGIRRVPHQESWHPRRFPGQHDCKTPWQETKGSAVLLYQLIK